MVQDFTTIKLKRISATKPVHCRSAVNLQRILGDRRKEMLEDIAVLTGGKAITEDLGIELENVKVEDLGRAKKVTIAKDNITIVEGAGKAAEIEGRIKQLRGLSQSLES